MGNGENQTRHPKGCTRAGAERGIVDCRVGTIVVLRNSRGAIARGMEVPLKTEATHPKRPVATYPTAQPDGNRAWPTSAIPSGIAQELHNTPTTGAIRVQALIEALLIPLFP